MRLLDFNSWSTLTEAESVDSSTSTTQITGSTFAERLLNNPMFKQWSDSNVPGGFTSLQPKDVEYALSRPGAKEWFMKSFNLDAEGNSVPLQANTPEPAQPTQPTATSTDIVPPTAISTGEIKKEDRDFDKVVATVIDKLEGGYFHPNMRTKDPDKFRVYDKSGETMFGLDRHAGHGLYYSTPRKSKNVLDNLKHIEANEYEYSSPEAKEFWETIDKANAKNTWKWGYRGGPLQARLTYLAGRIMKKLFDSLSARYLTKESLAMIKSDGRLLFNFAYAAWNGAGWFEKWAKDFNRMVASGEKNTDVLLNSIVNKRKSEGLAVGSSANSLISKGADKIKGVVGLA